MRPSTELLGCVTRVCFLQDKSSDVRKAAEACITEILRVSGQESVSELVMTCLSAVSLPFG